MPPMDISSAQYVEELQAEKEQIDPSCVHTIRLLAQEIDHALTGPEQEKMLDLQPDKQTSLAVRVRLPVKEYPKVNFAGRIIGPKGSTMKEFQEKTGTRLYVLGRGSMTDKKKEEDLRQAGGKYAHLSQDLHVRLESFAHPVEAYRRMSVALNELSAYLGPDEVGAANGAPYPGMRPMLQPGVPTQPGIPGPHGASMMAPRPPHRFPPDVWPMYQEPAAPIGSFAARQTRPSYPGSATRHPASNLSAARPSAATSFGQYHHGGMAQQPGDYHSQRAAVGGGKTLPYQTVGQYRAHPY